MLRIIFMGTSSFGKPCLDYLSSRDDVVVAGVVTKPQRPGNRGRILKDTPIKELAMEKGLKIFEQADVKKEDFAGSLRELKPDVSIVAAFGEILPKFILDIPGYGSVNIHASLLPLYRGPSPVNWAIINGERETGVTSFFMEQGVDTGAIISQRSIPILEEDDKGMLEHKLKNLAVEVLEDTLNKIKNGQTTANAQDDKKATFAPKITSQTGKIDWSSEGEKICNLIRGLSPRPGAYSFFKKGSGFVNDAEDEAVFVKIWKADAPRSFPLRRNFSLDIKEWGKVIGADSEGLKVFSGKGIVKIQELQPAGKKRMAGNAFWQGYG